jgi:hypothetical protein
MSVDAHPSLVITRQLLNELAEIDEPPADRWTELAVAGFVLFLAALEARHRGVEPWVRSS